MMLVLCFIACMLLGFYISTMSVSRSRPIFKKYLESMTKPQREKYQAIVKERGSIFWHSLVMSIILGVFFTYILSTYNKNLPKLCFLIAFTLSMTCILYLKHPKSDYMIRHLNTPKQKEYWLRISKMYQGQKIIGLTVGALAYFMLAGHMLIRQKKN